MSMINEFKQFAIKGNVVDMAVGVIIGTAFGKIVSSLVSDVIMPPIGMLIGGMDFSRLAIKLQAPIGNEAPVVISYGKFIQTVIDFTIIAAVIFFLIKGINTLKKKHEEAQPAAPPAPSRQEVLLEEIRDLLKNRQG